MILSAKSVQPWRLLTNRFTNSNFCRGQAGRRLRKRNTWRTYESVFGQMTFFDSSLARVAEPMEEAIESKFERSQTLTLEASVCSIPHPEKLETGGEDAHFISTLNGGSMGVADGVGGWRESGIDPADYSQTFMRLCRSFLENDAESMNGTENNIAQNAVQTFGRSPQGALEVGHKGTKLPGSSTAVVIQMDLETQMVRAANLGDSGFMVVRDGQVLMQSRFQQHFFDCPFQFGYYPAYVEATDTVLDSDTFNIEVQEGDIIIVGTDGLWDNCFPHEMLQLIKQNPDDMDKLAAKIGKKASINSLDPDFASPYIIDALNEGIDLPWWEKLIGASFKNGSFQLKQMRGGKLDDITVIAAVVKMRKMTDVDPKVPDFELNASSDESESDGSVVSSEPSSTVVG
eukprot:TRINITY_DN3087_c0_g1_i4.p1 TRINITY_DN3087_c0_g1~~TRINITY_DN3087_c0_g1_i4.p1  ORF type:complete len:439 (+),score=59.54 TRINITY_DN3087_c0_g1_i4:116-1318(+)